MRAMIWSAPTIWFVHQFFLDNLGVAFAPHAVLHASYYLLPAAGRFSHRNGSS